MNRPIWQEFELVQDFMAVLVTCKFEDDSIKSRCYPAYFFSLRSLREKFPRSRASNTEVNSPIWPEIKNEVAKSDIFPITNLWEISVVMETRTLIQSAQKPYAAFPQPH